MGLRFAIIGSSTPLQKTLPLFEAQPNVSLLVFLDAENDSNAIKWCEKNHISWHDSKLVKSAEGESLFKAFAPNWILSINSTVIIPEIILSTATTGALNLHPGKLPEYAGLHTHQWAIRNGETQFGVTIHHMQTGIDTGAIAFQTTFELDGNETGLSLYLKCISEGTKMFQQAIETIISGGQIPSIPQDLKLRKLYTHKMALDGKINFEQSCTQILNFIRAGNYEPFQSPTYKPVFEYKGQWIQVLKAQLSNHKLKPGELYSANNAFYIGTSDFALEIVKAKDENGRKFDFQQL